MFERFTKSARHVVVLAQDEARGLNHNYIGTEHLLLALLREQQGPAARVLGRLGISAPEVRQEIRAVIGTGQKPPKGHIPFTPRAKKVLELSLREAVALRHSYIGTEHLLLGLVREGSGVAAQILIEHTGDLASVRMALLDSLPASHAPEPRRWLRRRGGPPGRARSAPTTCCWPRWPTRTPRRPVRWPRWGWTWTRPGRRYGTRTSPAPATRRPRRPGA